MRDRISNVISNVKERLFRTPEREDTRRYERLREREDEARTMRLEVWAPEQVVLRPFSAELQYSAETKRYRDMTTGRIVSKSEYRVRQKNWRLETAASYIARAHPEWTEAQVVDALLRIEELRREPTPDEWIDIEIGAIFTP